MDAFFNILNSISPLGEEEREAMAKVIVARQLKKGEHWIEEGKKARLLAFIEQGYLRKYYVAEGKEITDFFYFDNSFTGDLPSMIANKASFANVIAMEPTTLLTISYDVLMDLCTKYHAIERIMRVFTEQAFVTFYQRSISFISSSPKERYNQLFNEHPEILQRATQYHIASYLGITPQHLSRLRASK